MNKILLCFGAGMLSAGLSFSQSGPSAASLWPLPIKDTRPLRSTPRPTSADKSKVMDLFQNQQFEEAIGYLNPALGEDSANVPVLGYLGYAYYMSEEPRGAERCYQRIFDLDSVNINALHYLEVLNFREEPDLALVFAQRLVDLQPGKSAWWRTKGDLLRRLKQPDSALASYSHALELGPDEAKNSIGVAELLIEKKDYTRADSILTVALARDSLNFGLLKLRMRSAYNAKDYAAVLASGETIIRLNLPDINAQSWLALSYYNLKQYPECVRTCEFLLNAGFDVESVLYYESRALAKLKQYQESNVLLALCLKKAISETAEWYHNDLADNQEALKDYRQCMAHYDTSFYLFKDPIALYNCGRIAESSLHDNALARKYYRRYLALAHPTSPEEKKAFIYVRQRWGIKKAG